MFVLVARQRRAWRPDVAGTGRGNSDHSLEMSGQMALIREANQYGNLGHGLAAAALANMRSNALEG